MASNTFSDTFIPKAPQNVALPSLSRGMVRNKPSTSLPEGAVYLAANWVITEKGPTRRCGSIKFAGGATVAYAPIRDAMYFIKSDGTQKIGVLDTRFLYAQSGANLVRKSYGTSAGTIKTSGAHVVGNASTTFTAALLRANDIIDLRSGTASSQELYIASILTKSHLLLSATPTLTYPAGSTYKVFKTLNYVKTSFVDHVVVDDAIMFADGGRPIQKWNGSTFGLYTAGLTFIPKCLAYWMDRFFAGNTLEGSTYYKHRIRWSTTLNHASFIGSPDSQWQDRPYGTGELLRLVPMGKLLVAYYQDRIDVGRPTNYAGDVLPVQFEGVDTGGAGLVGPKAIARFYDGHFIVLDDGIYYFSGASGVPQNIGEDIWKDATAGIKIFSGVVACVDWQNESVLFAFPDVSGAIQSVWRFNYKSKAWSRDDLPCTSLSTIMQITAPTIDGASGSIDSQTAAFDDNATDTWKQVSFGRAGALSLLDRDAADDFDGSPIEAVLETGDISWQAPNDIKSVFSLTLKTDRLMEVATTFLIEGSTNRGATWKNLGTMTVAANDDENQVGFKLMGSMLRFRITCTTKVASFTIAEVVLRVRGRGRELRFSTVD